MRKYRIWTCTKTFSDIKEMSDFINEYVGDKYYWQIRPHTVYVDGLTMIVTMRNSKCCYERRNICEEKGFTVEYGIREA